MFFPEIFFPAFFNSWFCLMCCSFSCFHTLVQIRFSTMFYSWSLVPSFDPSPSHSTFFLFLDRSRIPYVTAGPIPARGLSAACTPVALLRTGGPQAIPSRHPGPRARPLIAQPIRVPARYEETLWPSPYHTFTKCSPELAAAANLTFCAPLPSSVLPIPSVSSPLWLLLVVLK